MNCASRCSLLRSHLQRWRLPQGISRFRHISSLTTCPSAVCQCRTTPADLDIDRKSTLNGTAPFYAEQAVICTGRSDWPSRIEDDERLPFVQSLKGALGRGGKYSNPFHNVLLTASSFLESSGNIAPDVLLFPSFTQVSFDRQDTLHSSVDALIRGFVNPPSLPQRMLLMLASSRGNNSGNNSDSKGESNSAGTGAGAATTNPLLIRNESLQRSTTHSAITTPTILICGHGERDSRCGIMGALLEAEFKDKLQDAAMAAAESARVGLISHIGGHKFAGNVIVYIPPTLTEHPLAGAGVWYGRVEPKHVEGIVRATVQQGKVIQELFRGGIDAQRQPLRLH